MVRKLLGKKRVIFIIFLVSLFFMSAVNAADNATGEVINLENTEPEYVLEYNDSAILESDETNSFGSFSELSRLIRSTGAGEIITLEKDYKVTDYSYDIQIDKIVTIDGQGHTIDANHLSSIFYVTSKNVTLKNINFINGDDLNGGGIYFAPNSYSNIINSSFVNCSGKYGGAIYFGSNSYSYVINSSFVNCSSGYGGAVYYSINATSNVIDSQFKNNVAEVFGGSLLTGGSCNISLLRTSFIKSFAQHDSGGAIAILSSTFNANYIEVIDCLSKFGGAIVLLSSNSKISNSIFKGNNATFDGGAIYTMYNSLNLENNVFSENSAKNGGALYFSKTDMSIINNQFINNFALDKGIIYSMSATDKIIENNIFKNNFPSQTDFYETENNNLTIENEDYFQINNQYASYNMLPNYYNLADEGFMTPVKNQGINGNCWAFAAIATLESCILKASNLTLDLSEANLKNIMAHYSNYGRRVATNDGGRPEMVFGYLASWLGPIYEIDDVYYENSFLSPLLDSIFHVQNILFLKRDNFTDNNEIKDAILRYGAVGTDMYFDDMYLKNSISYYYNGVKSNNHAVCIVGWDDNYDKSNFRNIPEGNGAWIVRNNWGPSWGDGGYFYVSYYDTCLAGFDDVSSFTFIFNDTINFNRIYQLEIMPNAYYESLRNEVCYKNIFTVEGDEYLAAVSTYFAEKCEYKVSIYINNDLKCTKIGKTNAGYYTIDLNDLIFLNTGDQVSVVFNCSNFESGLGSIPVSNKYFNMNLYTEKGVSYYWDKNKWCDFESLGRVACIKMFTTFSKENKINPYLQLSSQKNNSDKSYIINILLPSDAKGFVSLKADNKEYTIDISKYNSITLSDLNNNTLFVKYSGDDKYFKKESYYIVDTNASDKGNFEELYDNIISTRKNNVLTFDKDYAQDSSKITQIDIKNEIIIDGQGHYIVLNESSILFNIYADNVVLKNINFIGGPKGQGNTIIGVRGSHCSIINCTFSNNYATWGDGAVYWAGSDGLISNCSFKNNSAYEGGALYLKNNCNLTNCIFENNSASKSGGAIYTSYYVRIDNCSFKNNNAKSGKDVCVYEKTADIFNSKFINEFPNDYSNIHVNGKLNIIDSIFYKHDETSNDRISVSENAEVNQINIAVETIESTIKNTTNNSSNLDIDDSNNDNGYIDNGDADDTPVVNPELKLKDSYIFIYHNSGNYAGENISLSFNVPFSATGTISLYLNNTFLNNIRVGENFNLINLSAGKYIVKARYNGDSYYNWSESIFSLDVYKEVPSLIVDVKDIKFGEIAHVDLSLKTKYLPITGYINISNYYFGKKTIKLINGKCSVDIPYLPVGEHGIYAEYLGDENHNYRNAFVLFNVTKGDVSSNIVIPALDESSGDSFSIELPIMATGKITFSVNNQNYNYKIVNGLCNIIIPDLSNGNYSYTISYPGDHNYSPFSKTGTLTINKIKSQITSSSISVVYNSEKYLIASLKDINDNPINNAKVLINLNGVRTLITDSNGQVIISTRGLTPKTYLATVTFNGNNAYENSTTTVKVTVKKATPKITAKSKTFKKTDKTKKYAITLKNNKNKAIKNAKITIKVNKKTYSVKTNSRGVANFKLSKLVKKGKFAATVKYAGSKYYNSVTKKIKITIR